MYQNKNVQPLNPSQVRPVIVRQTPTITSQRSNTNYFTSQTQPILIQDPTTAYNPYTSYVYTGQQNTLTTVVEKPEPEKLAPKKEDVDDIESIISDTLTETDGGSSNRIVYGFHPYYDKETDTMSLQCCTCCIGCWRNCSSRCMCCESLISCPIYCWVMVILPFFLVLLAGLTITSLYAAGVIK